MRITENVVKLCICARSSLCGVVITFVKSSWFNSAPSAERTVVKLRGGEDVVIQQMKRNFD